MEKKRMSYKKGRKHELEYKKILEERGYLVSLAPTPTKWNKEVDYFGLFDGMAIKEHEKPILFQVKTNSTGGVLKKLSNFAQKYPLIDFYLIIRKTNVQKNKWREIELK